MDYSGPGRQIQGVRSNSNLPISISQAQRQAALYSTLSRMTAPKIGRDSRIGEIMYDVSARGRITNNLTQTRPVSRFLPWLLPGIITILLLIFVLVCIYQHSQHPLSKRSLTDRSSRRGGVLPSPNENSLFQQERNNASPGDLPTGREQPFADGTCRKGFYYLQGMCYPCLVGQWDGRRCIVDSKNPSTQSGSQNSNDPQRNPNQFMRNGPNQSSNSQQSTNSNSDEVPQHRPCKDGQVLINGRCTSCPPNSIWNGESCQRVGSSFNTDDNSPFDHSHSARM